LAIHCQDGRVAAYRARKEPVAAKLRSPGEIKGAGLARAFCRSRTGLRASHVGY
jgi:hypothetical protein